MKSTSTGNSIARQVRLEANGTLQHADEEWGVSGVVPRDLHAEVALLLAHVLRGDHYLTEVASRPVPRHVG